MKISHGMILVAGVFTMVNIGSTGVLAAQGPATESAAFPVPRLVYIGSTGGPAAQVQVVPTSVTRVFQLEHVQPGPLAATLSLFDAAIMPNNPLKTLTVRAPADIMPAIVDVIGRLDVLKVEQGVEVTAYILSAGDQGTAGTPVPEHLQSVVDQLQEVFSYSRFGLIDTIMVRGFEDRPWDVSGMISLPEAVNRPQDEPTHYDFGGSFGVVQPDDAPPRLRIYNMRADFRVPVMSGDAFSGGLSYTEVSIGTDVEIPSGAQVVVGKSTIGASALFLVMTAEFLN